MEPSTVYHSKKTFANAPNLQSSVDSIVFGRDMDFSGDTKYDEEFTSMFDKMAGLPSWHNCRE